MTQEAEHAKHKTEIAEREMHKFEQEEKYKSAEIASLNKKSQMLAQEAEHAK